ncbi:ADP-ribosylglycohydrolase family protein [Parabacteroides gordonii]|uniref:ADP-ribosylglycohydrolase family protein n=1 Tax=Parabacteroides gordonii TaxID=574930 RepID=UPI0026EF5A0F|nr:ADP-ribosylglycohydrolase family protein [Parabacteroides gordonii]
MTGAIAGDIIGSVYEFDNIKTTDFPLFTNESDYTDDTIMTVAVADWLLNGRDLAKVMQRYGREYPYPTGGYGGRFSGWLREKDPLPYNSWGNGSAMRVSAVGWMFDSLEKTLEVAKETAVVTHNHPEGIKGAQATAAAIYLARTGKSKQDIKQYIETTFSYDLGRTCDEIRPFYRFNESCQGTVPEAIIAFLDSSDFENAIRLAVSLGGDSDTLACITGGIAEAFYGIPEDIKLEVKKRIPEKFNEIISQLLLLR